jgi:hypothetical protein
MVRGAWAQGTTRKPAALEATLLVLGQLVLSMATRQRSSTAEPCGEMPAEVDAFYWTVLAPDIVNPGREEQGSFSV